MTNTAKRIRFIRKFAALTQHARMFGLDFIVTDFYRTTDRQQELYAAGKSQCDGINNKSKHQDWLAIDICLIKDGECVWERVTAYELLGKYWKKIGGIWGGDWESLNDIYHFEAGESSEWFQA